MHNRLWAKNQSQSYQQNCIKNTTAFLQRIIHQSIARVVAEHCRALQAYLSIVPSFSDGGSGLVSIADGCCGDGSSDKPANDRDRGREHQRARTRFTLAGFRRIAGMQRSLPRRGAATHHACPAWYPFRAPTSRRSGAGGQEFDSQASSILPM